MTRQSDREDILTRIERALGQSNRSSCGRPVSKSVTQSPERDWLNCLAEQCQHLGTTFVRANSFNQIIQTIMNDIKASGFERIGLGLDHRNWPHNGRELVTAATNGPGSWLIYEEGVRIQSKARIEQLSQLDVIITGADAIIAETGTVVINSGRTDGRLGSSLAPHHWIIAPESLIIPTLSAYCSGPDRQIELAEHSCLSLISGPSRTADIEKQIVIGVHGPIQVKLYLYVQERG
ncbi:LUD domain-containing protein [bacterium]|nr:LUD domain-containing protein [bacterium]